MNQFLIVLFTLTVLSSCDVKRQDKINDDSNNSDSAKKAAAMDNPTSVTLIDSVFNFGTITEGEKVAFSYRFKNTGKTPLLIMSASASCGCTVPEKPEKPILPGEEGFIKVVFNSSGKVGQNSKDVTVNANTSPAFPVLKLIGEVKAKQ